MVEIVVDDLSLSLEPAHPSEFVSRESRYLPLSSFFNETGYAGTSTDAGDGERVACVSDIRTALALDGCSHRLVHERLLTPDDPNAELDQVLIKIDRDNKVLVQTLVSQSQVAVPLFVGVDCWLLAARPSSMVNLDDSVQVIGPANVLSTHDIYLMRDAEMQGEGFLESRQDFFGNGAEVIAAVAEGLVVAIPADASIDDFHFPRTQHGHNLKLIADPALVERHGAENFAPQVMQDPNGEDLDLIRNAIQSEAIAELVAQLSGENVSPVGEITSRHIHHAHCDRALELIRHTLREAGLEPKDHQFFHEGKAYANIYADIVGESDEMVLVTAHLDSTAGRDDPDYLAASDPAPGADDDASGVAAVLALAQAANEISARRATIRLVLFHAEEHGLVGSRHFARAAAAAGHEIKAAFQMDMIGFRPNPNERRVEIHYGCAALPHIEQRSAAVAELLRRSVEVLGELAPIEVYRSPNDPADGRSDHSSLQMSGYPAAIISEDFFGGTVEQPSGPPNNPQYHSATDTMIDTGYAAAIARVASLAALTAAR